MLKKLTFIFLILVYGGSVVVTCLSLHYSNKLLTQSHSDNTNLESLIQPYLRGLEESIGEVNIRLDELEKMSSLKDKNIQNTLDSLRIEIINNKNMIQRMRRASQIMYP